MKNYPDISHLFAAKEQRRRELAALSWEEKVAIIEKMQRLLPRGKWRLVASEARQTTPAAKEQDADELGRGNPLRLPS